MVCLHTDEPRPFEGHTPCPQSFLCTDKRPTSSREMVWPPLGRDVRDERLASESAARRSLPPVLPQRRSLHGPFAVVGQWRCCSCFGQAYFSEAPLRVAGTQCCRPHVLGGGSTAPPSVLVYRVRTSFASLLYVMPLASCTPVSRPWYGPGQPTGPSRTPARQRWSQRWVPPCTPTRGRGPRGRPNPTRQSRRRCVVRGPVRG